MDKITELTGSELLVIAGTMFSLIYLIVEVFGYDANICGIFSSFFSIFTRKSRSAHGQCQPYGYGYHNGPATWKYCYPSCNGKLQSPVNIISKCAVVIPNGTNSELKFMQDVAPQSYTICNTGTGVSIYGEWSEGKPSVRGGPLKGGSYTFVGANFKWGPSDEEGSEHTIDDFRYAMELQVMYLKNSHVEFKSVEEAVAKKAVAIVSYVYQITAEENPFLETFISNLSQITAPCTQHCFTGFPLCWLVVPFAKNYYSYRGSLSAPPCTEGVHWIVQVEPLAVSARQVQQFRKLRGMDGCPIMKNTRPVQHVKTRSIYYYD